MDLILLPARKIGQYFVASQKNKAVLFCQLEKQIMFCPQPKK